MTDINTEYAQKLGRFNSGTCMDIYYSEPEAKGIFNQIQLSASVYTGYISLYLTLTDFVGYCPVGYIFSSGIISGVVSANLDNELISVDVNKDSFVTQTALDHFISKHDGISYQFEALRNYNTIDNPENSVISDIMIDYKKRVNKYSSYSPFEFNYNKDFYYEVYTKTIVLRDLSQIDDILRASSYVIKSEDESYIRAGVLDDLPNVLGIENDTKNIVQQPYFGGLQNNEWYRATMIDSEFVWDKGRYKGKFKFKVTG